MTIYKFFQVLKERFKVCTFLGLTATATMSTINSIIDHLNIPKEEMINAVLQNTVLPDNLMLTVSQDENKDWALVKLLKQAPFSEYDSIIIYCLRRNECERLASFLRTSLEVTVTFLIVIAFFPFNFILKPCSKRET